MNKIICLSLITLLSISSFAQDIPFKIQKSEVFKDEFKESQIVLSEEDRNGGILIVRSYKGNGISPNAGYYFEHYDGNLQLIKEYDFQIEHPISQKNSFVLGVFRLYNKIQIIELFYDLNEKAYICVANSIRGNDFVVEKNELFRLTRDMLKEYGNFSITNLSYDKSDKRVSSKTTGYFTKSSGGIAIIANENVFSIAIDLMGKNNSESLKLFLFDDKLNKKIDRVFTKKISDRKYVFQNIDLSNDGNSVYLLAKSFSKESKTKIEGGKYQFEITKFLENKEQSKTFDISEHFIGSLKTISFDDKLVCIGFYSDIDDKYYKGVSYYEIDPNNLEIRLAKFNPFTEQFLIDKYGKIKEKELDFLNFKNILVTPDNDIILNAEESYFRTLNSVGYGMTNNGIGGLNTGGVYIGSFYNKQNVNTGFMYSGLYFGGIYENSFNHFDDIVSIKINSKGDLIWARNINKRQSESSSFSLASYTSVLNENNNMFFFINAKEKIKEISNNRIEFKGIGNLNVIRINPNGDFEYQKILDDDENEVPFMVSNGIKSGNSVFFLGRKGSTKQLLKITL
jgi:hypothetical protein